MIGISVVIALFGFAIHSEYLTTLGDDPFKEEDTDNQ